MKWHDLPKVKKGDIAEKIVEAKIIEMGFIPYRPVAGGAHPFDVLCASRDKQHIFIADSKGKPRRHSYPDTGINVSHFETYMNIQYEHNLRVYLFFVDEEWGRVYGNFLDELIKPYVLEYNNKVLDYPRKERGMNRVEIIYFPIANMEMLCVIEDADIKAMKAASTRKPKHQDIYEGGVDLNNLGVVVQGHLF